MEWPSSVSELVDEQMRIASMNVSDWRPDETSLTGGVFVCFERGGTGPGEEGDLGWSAAAVRVGRRSHVSTVTGLAGATYTPGLLALREGRLLDAAVRSLAVRPDVLLVDATGRDHPRRAGLAVHLGAVLDIPTVGVTNRPLVAFGTWPGEGRLATSPLSIGGDLVGFRLRTRETAKPVCIHAGWRTSPEVAVEVVVAVAGRYRTPGPLRTARTLARRRRSTD
jgi:deoxyribonuclease V